MATAPGRIQQVLENPLPRPRDRASDAFFALYRTIDAVLRTDLALKGSGGDLRTSKRANFASLEMGKLYQLQAVFAGKVVFAAPFQGYGNTVILLHPGRVFTLYAGLSDLKVGREGMLSLGDVVGLSTDKLYFEIPNELLGKELLLVSRIASTASNIGYGGEKANTQVVRWQKQDKKVLLRIVSYENVADEEEPIYQAVRKSNYEPPVASFGIESLAKDSAGVLPSVTGARSRTA